MPAAKPTGRDVVGLYGKDGRGSAAPRQLADCQPLGDPPESLCTIPCSERLSWNLWLVASFRPVLYSTAIN